MSWASAAIHPAQQRNLLPSGPVPEQSAVGSRHLTAAGGKGAGLLGGERQKHVHVLTGLACMTGANFSGW